MSNTVQRKVQSDLVFVKNLAESKSFDEVKQNINNQVVKDKEYIQDITGIDVNRSVNKIQDISNTVKSKVQSDFVFVKSIAKSKSFTEVKENINNQVVKDKEYIHNITGVNITKIQDKIKENIKDEATKQLYDIIELTKLRRVMLIFMIFVYIFYNPLFFIICFCYAVYHFNLFEKLDYFLE